MVRASAASTAPTAMPPRAPASDTAAASAGVDTPAIGAWKMGSSMRSRSRKLVMLAVEFANPLYGSGPRIRESRRWPTWHSSAALESVSAAPVRQDVMRRERSVVAVGSRHHAFDAKIDGGTRSPWKAPTRCGGHEAGCRHFPRDASDDLAQPQEARPSTARRLLQRPPERPDRSKASSLAAPDAHHEALAQHDRLAHSRPAARLRRFSSPGACPGLSWAGRATATARLGHAALGRRRALHECRPPLGAGRGGKP